MVWHFSPWLLCIYKIFIPLVVFFICNLHCICILRKHSLQIHGRFRRISMHSSMSTFSKISYIFVVKKMMKFCFKKSKTLLSIAVSSLSSIDLINVDNDNVAVCNLYSNGSCCDCSLILLVLIWYAKEQLFHKFSTDWTRRLCDSKQMMEIEFERIKHGDNN